MNRIEIAYLLPCGSIQAGRPPRGPQAVSKSLGSVCVQRPDERELEQEVLAPYTKLLEAPDWWSRDYGERGDLGVTHSSHLHFYQNLLLSGFVLLKVLAPHYKLCMLASFYV